MRPDFLCASLFFAVVSAQLVPSSQEAAPQRKRYGGTIELTRRSTTRRRTRRAAAPHRGHWRMGVKEVATFKARVRLTSP